MKSEDVTFTIECTMKGRWVPHFLSMLNYMQYLGNIGSSRKVALYSDGDGDFRPKFGVIGLTKDDFPKVVEPREDNKGNRLYDAG
jgi:hypothetical protein